MAEAAGSICYVQCFQEPSLETVLLPLDNEVAEGEVGWRGAGQVEREARWGRDGPVAQCADVLLGADDNFGCLAVRHAKGMPDLGLPAVNHHFTARILTHPHVAGDHQLAVKGGGQRREGRCSGDVGIATDDDC